MRKHSYTRAGHMRHLELKEWKASVKDGVANLKPRRHLFDAIAFRGMSGAIIAPAIAARLNKPVLMVRKDGGPPQSGTSSLMISFQRVIRSR